MRLLPIVAGLMVAVPAARPPALAGQTLLPPRFPPTAGFPPAPGPPPSPAVSGMTGPSPPSALSPTSRLSPSGPESEGRTGPQIEPGPSRAVTALLSALLPGAGQHVLGQRRKWAYLALEAVGWVVYSDRRSAAYDFRSRYRDFAWNEARLQLGARIDGDFDYYETMSKWQRSGLFDADPAAPSIQPESDEATYNGAIWARAEQLYLEGGVIGVPETDSRYQSALAYYRERAYGTEFLWDWTGTAAAQDDFAALIRASDDRFRQATNVLGLVLANHLVSMVDAFVSARARGTSVETRVVPVVGPSGVRWTTGVSVTTPW